MRIEIKSERTRDLLAIVLGVLLLTVVAVWMAGITGTNLLAHGAYDSYTLQAMRWREGHIALAQDYPWLELAVFEGRYYVSFPPTPTVPMLLLSFIFGENTPSALVTLLYFLGGYVAIYYLLRRYLSAGQSGLYAAFVSLGGSLLDLAVSGGGVGGGVWYQAQLLAFLLTTLAFLLLDRDRPRGWGIGLACIALAVGCRPLNALYAPVLLYLLYTKVKKETLWRTLRAMLPYIIAPALIACAYGAYNYARFGNSLEFGHSYLPEYTNAGTTIFSLANLPANIANILRMPTIENGALAVPLGLGFAVYLTNPALFSGSGRTLARAMRREADLTDAIVALAAILHAILLLTHSTNGGWQYGTRYLCDAVPALVYLYARAKKSAGPVAAAVMGALMAFNVYASVVFHFM